MVSPKKLRGVDLENVVSRAVDSICIQFNENIDLRPERILIHNGDQSVLDYFQAVLSGRFPLQSYHPVAIIEEPMAEDYSIDVASLLFLHSPKSV